MTVAELIAKLQEMPQAADVVLEQDTGYWAVTVVDGPEPGITDCVVLA